MSTSLNLSSNNRSILLVTTALRQRELKMAYALKKTGWFVALIYSKSTPFLPEGHFDFIQEVQSAKEAHQHARKLKPLLIHVFSGAIDDLVLLFCEKKIAPVIIDLNDVFVPALMDYCNERFNITKRVLSLADGYCARDLQVKRANQLDGYPIPKQILHFPEYCWGQKDQTYLPKTSDDEVHIVSVGTICLETLGMYDCCYLKLVEMITSQNINLHIYPPWCYRNDNGFTSALNFENDYRQFIELAHKNSYLHLHNSIPTEELAAELTQYDFGIIAGGYKNFGQEYTHFKPAYVESCYSGRITDYLDAGLPILINEEMTFNHWLLKRYHVSIDLKDVLHSDFKSKLQAAKKSLTMKRNVAKAREMLLLDNHGERLSRFYSGIIASELNKSKKRFFLRALNNARRLLREKVLCPAID